MANVLVEEQTLHDMGDAIREKNKETGKYTPADMVTKIQTMPSGGGSGVKVDWNLPEDVEGGILHRTHYVAKEPTGKMGWVDKFTFEATPEEMASEGVFFNRTSIFNTQEDVLADQGEYQIKVPANPDQGIYLDAFTSLKKMLIKNTLPDLENVSDQLYCFAAYLSSGPNGSKQWEPMILLKCKVNISAEGIPVFSISEQDTWIMVSQVEILQKGEEIIDDVYHPLDKKFLPQDISFTKNLIIPRSEYMKNNTSAENVSSVTIDSKNANVIQVVTGLALYRVEFKETQPVLKPIYSNLPELTVKELSDINNKIQIKWNYQNKQSDYYSNPINSLSRLGPTFHSPFTYYPMFSEQSQITYISDRNILIAGTTTWFSFEKDTPTEVMSKLKAELETYLSNADYILRITETQNTETSQYLE